jgi:hypothetical protein
MRVHGRRSGWMGGETLMVAHDAACSWKFLKDDCIKEPWDWNSFGARPRCFASCVCSFISAGAISDCAGAIQIAQLLRLPLSLSRARSRILYLFIWDYFIWRRRGSMRVTCLSSFDIKKRIFIAVKNVYRFSFHIANRHLLFVSSVACWGILFLFFKWKWLHLKSVFIGHQCHRLFAIVLGFFFLLGFFYSWCYKITMRRQKKRLRRCKATNRRRKKKIRKWL